VLIGERIVILNIVEYINYFTWLMLLNTGINATIYILRSTEIRSFYKIKFIKN